ncbi:MAG: 1-acyl-sn-glycerol-3-phosphate acyltransferase, partial [Clostridia bacterium]|nr:1-acyl-sn-glycerol-3-phosphate acyltransferase [Clostridia bacterium]
MKKKKDIGRRILYFVIGPLLKLLAWNIYRVRLSKEKKIKEQHLVLSNHSSLIDSVLISSMFRDPIYFVAASVLAKSKFWGKLLRLLTGVIPIDKAGFDIKAMRAVLKTRSQGRSIGVFPEGNNTINGAPLFFGIGIAKLAKQLKLPVALCNNYGGYFTHPKWATYRREGIVHGKIVRILSVEEVSALT